MTDEARGKAIKLLLSVGFAPDKCPFILTDITTALTSEREAGRNEGIEEAMNLYASNFHGSFLDNLRQLLKK